MGFITLLSDLGYNDTTVAKTKSILLQHLPGIPVIDVSHSIQPFYLPQAAYLLAASAVAFPTGSFHLALFDVYYNSPARYILTEITGSYYFAPDNGILPLAFPNHEGPYLLCYEQSGDDKIANLLQQVAQTIKIIDKEKNLSAAGLEIYTIENTPSVLQAVITEQAIECHVIHIDHFENVVLNITREQFETIGKGRPFSIQLLRDEVINTISNQYNDVTPGDKLCRFNSAGYLEIAINKGKAASLFGFRMIRGGQMIYNTIKITFE